MKKNIYLMRHGQVSFDGGIRRCIGRTDLTLSAEGRAEAKEAKAYFKGLEGFSIFSSPLLRAKETAEILAGSKSSVIILDDLQEMDMGVWENQPLREIKKELASEPEGGETRLQALDRMTRAMQQVIQASGDKDAVVVSHASMITIFLADLLGIPLNISRSLPQSYGSISTLTWDRDAFQVESVGLMPQAYPSLDKAKWIAKHYAMPDRVYEHGQAVAAFAIGLGQGVNMVAEKATSHQLDLGLLEIGALLHDISKTSKFHVEDGANILRREGYPQVASLIEAQDNLKDPLHLDNEAILFYADKRIKDDQLVSIEERFRAAKEKIDQAGSSRPAMESYYRRLRTAYVVHGLLEKLLGRRGLKAIEEEFKGRTRQ